MDLVVYGAAAGQVDLIAIRFATPEALLVVADMFAHIATNVRASMGLASPRLICPTDTRP